MRPSFGALSLASSGQHTAAAARRSSRRQVSGGTSMVAALGTLLHWAVALKQCLHRIFQHLVCEAGTAK